MINNLTIDLYISTANKKAAGMKKSPAAFPEPTYYIYSWCMISYFT